MQFSRILKNWLVINPVVVAAFGKIRNTALYRSMVVAAVQRRAQEMRAKRDYIIQIETTNLCNARCVFCSYTVMKREKKIMDDETFETIVRRIKEDGIKPYGVHLNGTGEPLLDNKIFHRIRRIKQEFPTAIVKFSSNFNLANEARIEEILTSGLDELNISLNSYLKDVYQDTMKIGYDRTEKNILSLLEKRKASGSKLKVRISMALVARNETYENEFLKKWTKLVDSVTINRVHSYSGAVAESAGDNKINYENYPLPCRSLWTCISIAVDGKILLCCLDYEANNNLGNSRDNGLLELYSSKKFEQLRQMHLSGHIEPFEMCAKCSVPYENGAHWFIKKLI